LNEGLYRFERLKATATETEQLKKEYMHSQLLGLKSQMNPHFLFNGLNTLSSLIHEDAEQAEDFLDHMSKVYRYLLRNNEEQLVSVGTELSFIRSYYYLLKARHAEGLQLHVEIPSDAYNDMIPPLTLQMILENSLSNNAVGRSNPLIVSICVCNGWIEVRNNIQPKINNAEENTEVIENIKNKFRLLCQQEVSVTEKGNERLIRLPLIPYTETMTA
jgi:LytS/YehU family sensor histidine kinase